MEYQVGKDVAQCLNEALAGSGLNVRVTALVGCFYHFVSSVATSVGSLVLFDHFVTLGKPLLRIG